MAIAVRADDGRRAKYRKLNQSQSVESLQEQIMDEIARRPQRQFTDGQIIHSPDGYREIISGFYSGCGWKCHVLNNGKWSENHLEKDCTPLFFNIGDVLTLPSGVKRAVHHISISKSGNPVFSFEIAALQFSIYSYAEILKYNPSVQIDILQMLWKSYATNTGDMNYIASLRRSVIPSLAT